MAIEDRVKIRSGESYHHGLYNKEFFNKYTGAHDAGSNLVLTEKFALPGTTPIIDGAWLKDLNNEINATEADTIDKVFGKEPRVYTKRGKLEFTFTGTNIGLRMEIYSNWGSADVYIDGVKPSLIPNVVQPVDVVEFDASKLPWTNNPNRKPWEPEAALGKERKDYVLASGLTDTEHKLTLYFNNIETENAYGWCAINGFMVYDTTANTLSRDGWVITSEDDAPIGHNLESIAVMANMANPVTDLRLTLDATSDLEVLNDDLTPFTDVVYETLPADGNYLILPFRPKISAITRDGTRTASFTLSWLQSEPGDFSVGAETGPPSLVALPPNHPDIAYTGTWYADSDGTGGVPRKFADVVGASFEFDVYGTFFDIYIQQNFGWGNLEIYVDDNLVSTLPCHADDAIGGMITPSILTGKLNASDYSRVRVVNAEPSSPDHSPIGVFMGVSFLTSQTGYREQVNLTYTYNLKYVPPFDLENVRIEDGKVTWDDIDVTRVDLTIPRDNRGVETVTEYWRYPTQITQYSSGYTETMTEYDLVIFEPGSQSYDDVKEWQRLGIINLGYVSFGEEDGWNTNPWGAVNQTPWIGDGTGPGGYASYYLKGGYHAGEFQECIHDEQKFKGTKTCAEGQPEYYQSVGRCGGACTQDSRTGYNDYSIGGVCNAGHTREDFWVRSASIACVNDACPDYAPLNQKCPKYETTWGNYMQDFSVMTTDFPDENGIWSSYYTNSAHPDWYAKLADYWLPKVFHEQVQVTEELRFEDHRVETGELNAQGVLVTKPPMDIGFTPIVKRVSDGYLYDVGGEVGPDYQTGVLKFYMEDDNPKLPAVDEIIEVTYYQRGLNADGVFMDTVDTVDVYPSEDFKQGMIDNTRLLKERYPNKFFCSNRGFAIVEQMTEYCNYVMFESYFSDYDNETGEYSKLVDQGSIDYNQEVHDLLSKSREKNDFEVVGLNYCSNDAKDDVLRAEIAEDGRDRGYLTWSSTIELNDPLPNDEIVTPYAPVTTNVWTKFREHKIGNEK